MDHKRQITRAAELACLASSRDFIDTHCKSCPGVDERTLYDLKLAVNEACSNITTHSYAGMDPGSIILNIEVEAYKGILEITDFGHAFEPCEAQLPAIQAVLDIQPTGGFGSFFIYQTMDQVDYFCSEDSHCLRLTMNLLTQQRPIIEANKYEDH